MASKALKNIYRLLVLAAGFTIFRVVRFPNDQSFALACVVLLCWLGIEPKRHQQEDGFSPYIVIAKVRWDVVFRELGWVEKGDDAWHDFMRRFCEIPTSAFSENGYRPVRDGIAWVVLKRGLQLVYVQQADDHPFFNSGSLDCSRNSVRSGDIQFPGFSVRSTEYPGFGFNFSLHEHHHLLTDDKREILESINACLPIRQFDEYHSEHLSQQEWDAMIKKRSELLEKQGWKQNEHGNILEHKYFTVEHAKI